MEQRPIVAVGLGDPAGIGSELVARALLDESIRERCRPLVVGTRWVLEQGFSVAGQALPCRSVDSPLEAAFTPGTIDVLEVATLRPEEVRFGELSEAAGRFAGETLVRSAYLVRDGSAHGMVTAPINKFSLGLAGFGHGHLEMLGEAAGATGEVYSMFAGPSLKVVNMTHHCSLVEACGLVKKERILAAIHLIHRSFANWGTPRARIAVCALNPHAGDNGVFGFEEIEEIEPAVAEARGEGIDARGPLPVDTLFARALGGEFDVVLAMYHDQGFTPMKTVALHDTASVGLGVPIPYATTDHGTGLDIAGKGIAHPGSFKQAFRVVFEMCAGRMATTP